MISLKFLLPEYRQRVLGLLLLHPQTRYHVQEIARLTNTTAGTLHRELAKLAKAQVLLRETSGHQVYYQANINYPIFNELASILQKTSGLADILEKALQPLAEKIEIAFIYGSIASGTQNQNSDIDLLIIGDISFVDAVTALYPTQAIVGREINPKIYRKIEWDALLKNKNAFLQEIINKPKIFIKGSENDIR